MAANPDDFEEEIEHESLEPSEGDKRKRFFSKERKWCYNNIKIVQIFWLSLNFNYISFNH